MSLEWWLPFLNECALLISGALWSLNYVKNESILWLSSWKMKFFLVMFLFSSVDQPAKAYTFDCHTAPCNFRQQTHVPVVLSHLVVSQKCWKSPRYRHKSKQERAAVLLTETTGRGNSWVKFAPKSCSHCTKEVPFLAYILCMWICLQAQSPRERFWTVFVLN